MADSWFFGRRSGDLVQYDQGNGCGHGVECEMNSEGSQFVYWGPRSGGVKLRAQTQGARSRGFGGSATGFSGARGCNQLIRRIKKIRQTSSSNSTTICESRGEVSYTWCPTMMTYEAAAPTSLWAVLSTLNASAPNL